MSLIANLAINLDARGALQGLRTFYQQSQSATRAADQLKVTVSSVSKSAAELGGSFSNATQQAQSAASGIQRYASSLVDAQDKSESAAGAIDTLQASTAAASEAANATSGEFDKLASGAAAVSAAASPVKHQFVRAANGMNYYVDAAGRVHRENGQIASTAEAVAAGLKQQTEEAKKAGDAFENLEDIAGKLGIALSTAGVAALAGGIIGKASTFEGELRKAAAIEGGGNFNQLRQDVERVAAAAAGTPTQVAALATSLSRAGFTAAETGQSLQGIVRGAEATAVSFEQMGSIASDVLRGFGIETAKTESVVDILVKTANSSNQTVQDLGESLKYAAPIARSLGVNITDLSATMAILANNGIRGSEAGTALRTGLAKLQLAASASNGELLDLLSGNKQLADSMKALGVSVTDASGKLKPLDDVLINLKRGLEGLGPGVQAEVLQALFGEEAGGKLRAALNSTEEEIRKMFGTIRAGAGAAASTQKEMQGFSYSMEVLGGNVEIVSNAIGDKFIAVLQPMVNGLNAALSEAQKLPKPLRDVAAGAAALGIAVGGVTLAAKTLIPVVTTLIGLLGPTSLAPLIAAGPWIALAAGIAAVVGAFASAAQEADRFNNVIASGTTEQLSQEMARLEKAIAAAESKTAGYQNELRGVGNQSGYASLEVQKLKDQLQQLQGTYNVRIQVEEIFTGGRGGKNVPQGYRLINGRLAYQVPGVGWVYADTGQPAQETAPPATPPRGGGGGGAARAGGGRGGKSEAEKAAEAAKRQAEELKRSYELGTQLGTQYQRQLLLLDASTDQERRRLQIQFDFEDREKQISELKSKTQQANLRDLSNEQKRLELRQLDLEYLREQLSIFERIAGLDFSKTADLGKRAFAGGGGTFDPSLPDLRVSPAEQQMAKYREELAALTNPINMAVTGADAIGNAFGQAFQDIATGAKSTQEALADAFKGIGEAFIQMAAQIIAKQLAMIAFQTILKALGGGGGGFGFSGAGPAALPSGDGFAAGFSMPALMADGGYVTGPTSAVVGEGGEPEYVIPASKMRSAMARYSSGARGEAVISGSGAEPAAGGGGAAVAAPIDVRYTVERINSVDYVTADQFQAGMRQAAEQGARRGEQSTLRRLQQSTATRRKLGM